MQNSSKSTSFRLKKDLNEKIKDIQKLKETETGMKLTRTQVIEMLITLGIEKLKEGGKL